MGLRRDGREAAVQYLFAHELHEPSGSKSDEERNAFWQLHSAKGGARKFAESLVQGVLENLKEIDGKIAEASTNFSLDRIANVDRNILRLAVYELMHTQDLPAPVIINEAIEIAKKFGAPESAGFVNGVIDRIARVLRPRAAAGAGRKPQSSASDPQPEPEAQAQQ